MLQSNNFFTGEKILAVCVCLLTACGINKNSHYDDSGKTFGRSGNNADVPATETGENQPPTPDRDDPPTPRDQLLSHYGFSGYFNLDTVRRMTRGTDPVNGEISQGGMLDSMLSTLLGTVIGEPVKEELEMIVRQSGDDRNLVTQKVETLGGDNIAGFKGEETQSGTQMIDWVLTSTDSKAECPQGFVCIERMVWIPVFGQTMTYCYRDPETKRPLTIPYSPNSQYGADSFVDIIGNGIDSQPFEVSSHPGNISCTDDNAVVQDRRLVVYKIRRGDLSDQNQDGFLQKAIHKKLAADTEISIQFSLYNQALKQPYLPKEGPYIDQLTRLNSKIRFFLNTEEHVLVKLERTVQAPFKFEGSAIADAIRETYGEMAAYIVSILFPKDSDTMGAQLVYSFEFCTHLGVINNPFNHCSGKTPSILGTQSKQ